MNCLLHSIFFDNPELPEQVCRFCESIPEYIQAREEYYALAQELEETMGRQWYFTFEDRLNQYCGWESRAYYLFGLNLRREILEGRNLEEMEFHWIDPECDRRLQEGLDEGEADKRRSISHILCDRENLAAIRAALSPTEWEADSPYCTFAIPYGERTVTGRFFGNEAALSKLPVLWFQALGRHLPGLERRGRLGLGRGFLCKHKDLFLPG